MARLGLGLQAHILRHLSCATLVSGPLKRQASGITKSLIVVNLM